MRVGVRKEEERSVCVGGRGGKREGVCGCVGGKGGRRKGVCVRKSVFKEQGKEV